MRVPGTAVPTPARSTPAGRRWPAPVLAAGVAVVLLTGCGTPAGASSEVAGSPVAASSTSPTPSSPAAVPPPAPSSPPAATTDAALYWVGSAGGRVGAAEEDGTPRLYREQRAVPDLGEPVLSAVTALLEGSPTDPDQVNAWRPAPVVVTRDGDALVIDVGAGALTGPAPSTPVAAMAVQQLARVAAQADAGPVASVTITVDGAPTTAWGAVELGQPLRLASDAEVLSPVQLTSPAQSQAVAAGPVQVRGESSTSEGTVVWEVTDAAGSVLAEGFATGGAYDGFAELAFTADVAGLVPGAVYTLAAWAPDESDGEGGPERGAGDTKDFTIG